MGYGKRELRAILMRGTIILLAAAAVAPAAALADATPAVEFDFRLSSQQPGSPTGASVHVLYKNPRDPAAKPSPLRTVTLYAPPGTRFDGGALPACAADDVELRLLGPSACSAASRVGDAAVSAITGLGAPLDPLATEGAIFNTGDGVVVVTTFKGTPVTAGWDRVKFVAPDTLEAHPPHTPGAPPDMESSLRDVRFEYATAAGSAGRPFITTPPTCPADGRWTARLHFTTKDGGSYDASSTMPCAPTAIRAAGTPPAGMRVHLSPRRIAVGRRVRVRIRVRSVDARCQRWATVRLAGRRVRTNRGGEVTLGVRVARRGSYRVLVSKTGCGRGAARLVAR